ncbi:MAG: glycosyltransferase [Cryomorphaceae bacterium]|nr:glycosyltransferase [Cryomorphaceae bacterium]
MNSNFDPEFWKFHEARKPSAWSSFILVILVFGGLINVVNFGMWWFKQEPGQFWLFFILTLIFWWSIFRMIIMWISYIAINKPRKKKAPKDLSVAIFTTSSPGEPLSMFDKTLEACKNIRYPHTTYLLDDTQDPAFKELAEKHGAVWLELVGIPGAKAGKINAALQKTKEDFILVMDPDHIPFPNFFDEVLGFFTNPDVGFVQVSQGYYNQYRSFVAQGAAEQTYGFYGPTLMGLYGLGSSVAIGANCTFRREALESIGGHAIGLAEDMMTAIRLHGKGWKSIYHPVIVTRGLVPEDLGSFCKQQLKWSRGVHEILFSDLPKTWNGLSTLQRLTYFGISTYYISGLTMFLFLILPYFTLWFDVIPIDIEFTEFLTHWVPLALAATVIYLYCQRFLSHPKTEFGLHLKGTILKFVCWPVFLQGFLLSLINGKIPYIPTAKQAVKGFTPFIRPHVYIALFFILTVIWVIIKRMHFTPEGEIAFTRWETWGMIFFAAIAFVMTLGGIYAAWQSRNLDAAEPWKDIDIEEINKLNPDEDKDY